ncbi:hypothetical protein HK102_006391, partial [Quaeritorhiza haematococci]
MKVPWISIIDMVEDHVVRQGVPVVVENLHLKGEWWDGGVFNVDWLRAHCGLQDVRLKNLDTGEEVENWNLGQYVNYLCTPPQNRRPQMQRIYSKHVTCPEEWTNLAMKGLTAYFMSRGVNDLIGMLPRIVQPAGPTLFLGTGGTWTPGHKNLCATIGHNLMVGADEGSSALWFITPNHEKHKVAEMWQRQGQKMGHPGASIDMENFLMPVKILAGAPFPVHVVEQRVGDMVIIPSDSAHQVLNKGGKTIKIGWDRHTSQTLKTCYEEILPTLRLISKPELYRTKDIIFRTVNVWTYELLTNKQFLANLSEYQVSRFGADYRNIIELFMRMIEDEWVELPKEGDSFPGPLTTSTSPPTTTTTKNNKKSSLPIPIAEFPDEDIVYDNPTQMRKDVSNNNTKKPKDAPALMKAALTGKWKAMGRICDF